MSGMTTVGEYLVRRLRDVGLDHVFGIPGDYVLGFYDQMIAAEGLDVIGTCTEIGAGYAADAYARVNGLGCVCITYCVGGLNYVNAVGGAYAEKSPLIVISGSPGMRERAKSPLLHHQVRDFHTQLHVYEKVTVAAVAIEDPADAPQLIDETIEQCITHKRPVYIELPRDIVHEPCLEPKPWKKPERKSDPNALKEAIAEVSEMMRESKRPAILAGVEIHRFNLQKPLLDLVKRTGYPVAATLLGKSVISERHEQYLGVYEGAMGKEAVQKGIEKSDCLLILGAFMTDINLGIWTADLDPSKTVDATSERISVGYHHYEDVVLKDFLTALTKAKIGKTRTAKIRKPAAPKPITPQPNKPVTVKRFFQRMDEYLGDNTVVICDIGDSLFGGADLTIHKRTEFLSPAYYTSMGFAVPAAIGAQMNNRKVRPIVFVGDGAFQMTGMELSTIARQQLNPIIFVLNNKGYTTERFINEGPYNDIHNWEYHLMPQILRDGWGFEVHTEGELEDALAKAKTNELCFSIINVHLDKLDRSEALARLGKRLGAQGTK